MKHCGKAVPVVSVHKERSRVFQQQKKKPHPKPTNLNANILLVVQLPSPLGKMLSENILSVMQTGTHREAVKENFLGITVLPLTGVVY